MALKSFLENTVGPLYARVAARPSLYSFNKALFHLSLRGMGLFNCTPASSGERHFIHHILPGLLKTESPTMLDVGANVGRYTMFLRHAFPQADIHSFEPHARNYETLRSNTGPDAVCHNSALGASEGTITLYDRADQDGSTHASVYREVITEWHQQNETQHEVAVQTLDNFAEQNNIQFIDFIKIDTEGHEYDVLQGAERLLAERRIGVIQFEFGCLHCYSHHFLGDFKKHLVHHDLYRILPHHLLPLDKPPVEVELFGHQNIVALPKDR